MTFVDFIALVTASVTLVTDAIGIMMEPPIIWFVALGFLGAVIATAKKLVPRKRAK